MKTLTPYEEKYKKLFGEDYIIGLKDGYFESWGFPNTFTKDWNLALHYKNIKTVKNAIKKLRVIHQDNVNFKYIQIKDLMIDN